MVAPTEGDNLPNKPSYLTKFVDCWHKIVEKIEMHKVCACYGAQGHVAGQLDNMTIWQLAAW